MINNQAFVNASASMAGVSHSLQKMSDALRNVLDTQCICWSAAWNDGHPKIEMMVWTRRGDRYAIICKNCNGNVRMPAWFAPLGVSN